MAIKLKTEEGLEFSFDTVEELMYFQKKMDAKLASKETESTFDEEDVPGNEPKFEEGDKVRVVSAEDGTDSAFHGFRIGSTVEVIEVNGNGRVLAHNGIICQTLLPHHFEKVESLGKDANGEDLFVGDRVTGTEDNDYGYTNSTVDMEVLGEGSSFIDEEANIRVRIIGDSNTYGVDSSKFVKLSDDLTEDPDSEEEFKVGDKVRVVGNSSGHCMEVGEVREITVVDSDEPKYNLSCMSRGRWANTKDIEHADSPTEFKTGDIVRVTEEFEDHFGGRAHLGDFYDYNENFGLGEPFIGTVLLGDNNDKIELVCRAQDRLDI